MKCIMHIQCVKWAVLLVACSLTALGQEKPQSTTMQEVGNIWAIPRYPRMAVATGQSGEVIADLEANPDGSCKVIAVNGAARFLKEAVETTVSKWTFIPSQKQTFLRVKFLFRLLPADANEIEVISEIFPRLNLIVVRTGSSSLLTIVDPPQVKKD